MLAGEQPRAAAGVKENHAPVRRQSAFAGGGDQSRHRLAGVYGIEHQPFCAGGKPDRLQDGLGVRRSPVPAVDPCPSPRRGQAGERRCFRRQAFDKLLLIMVADPDALDQVVVTQADGQARVGAYAATWAKNPDEVGDLSAAARMPPARSRWRRAG